VVILQLADEQLYLPILLALLSGSVVFIVAVTKGVVPLLSSGCATAAGLLAMVIALYLIPVIGYSAFEGGVNWKLNVGIAAGLGLVVMVICRFIFGAIFRRLMGGESRLNSLMDGFAGGVLSLVPSIVGILLMFTGFRVAGTVMELNYTASLAREGVIEMAGKIPPYPKETGWRNMIEKIPVVPTVLDVIDPFSNRANRNAAAMVIVGGSGSLRSFMKQQPESSEIANVNILGLLASDEEIAELVTRQDRAGLVLHPKVRQTASNPELNGPLRKLNLQRSLEGFVESLGPGE